MRALSIGVMVLAATSAHAERAKVLINNYPGYGRVIIPLNGAGPFSVTQTDNQVSVTVPPRIQLSTPIRVPRNVAAIEGGAGTAQLTIAEGARLQQKHAGNLLILDILDPIAPARPSAMANERPNPAFARPGTERERPPARIPAALPPSAPTPPPAVDPAAAPQTSSTVTPAPPAVTDPPSAPQPGVPNTAPAPPVVASPPPAPPQAAPTVAPPPQLAATAPIVRPPDQIRIAAGGDVGAVAFRRGDYGVVVFDDRIELPAIDGERPGRAKLRRMQGGTMLTIPIDLDESLVLKRDRDTWVIKLGAPPSRPASQAAGPDGVTLQFDQPGRAMTVSDPITGQTLLIGTVRGADDAHAQIEERRSGPGYVVVPTWLGLVVEATADATDLRAVPTGFALHVRDRTPQANAVVATGDNPFAIPNAPSEVLMQRLDTQVAGAASLPPRSRGKERVAAARTMLALGMAAEAQALLTLAANDDPAVAADPLAAALTGIAAVMAGRPGEAAGLDHPDLPASTDVALWRGVRDVAQGKPAPLLASSWANLARYPDAVRQRIAPPVIEASITAGAAIPSADLQGRRLAFARALQQAKAGEVDPALEALDAIEQSRDERDSVRAAVAAVELRLSNGKIAAGEAADRLERLAARWRGDGQELAIRLRQAEFRTAAGQWRAALESLRQTETLFPESKERVAGLKTQVFTSVLNAKQETLNPLEIVTIAGDFADCIPPGAYGEQLAALLAEKLAALDLPTRAIPVLQNLVDKTEPPAPKAEFALRLAQLQLDAGEFAKAETVLGAVDANALSPDRVDQRTVLLARAQAGRGDPAGAAELLANSSSPEATELRASMLAKAGDWKGSLRALEQLAAMAVPASGDLNEAQQDLLLRQATAAVQAREPDTLRKLRQFESRLKAPRAELFKLLTANPVESADDLPRAARELAMSRGLPGRLDALKLR